MDDLIAFLGARLDEDEQAARRATEGPWSVGDSDTNGGYEVYSEEGSVAIQGHYGGGVPKQVDAEHIARHDPARVLREVEAKRQMLAFHDRAHPHDGDPCTTQRLLVLPYADHPDYRPGWKP